jgi:hypothetical protein
LPAFYIRQEEDEGRTTCLWFGDEEVRGTSLTISTANPDGLSWSANLAASKDVQSATCTYRLPVEARPSKHSQGYYHATAEFRTVDASGKLRSLMLSLFSADPDLQVRLEDLARGVWFDAPRAPPKKDHLN